ncbi:uncharacterized protein NDAI_0H01650 [Naumovozyma dairenensis CBS 421]|uniref:Proline dehydrogenase n=1 Tax=Naumovozyma dairenensis (strain ATCC 10597 / BCRC 20456 / CBS 421 / NBRC 0211 / NRRL Y-12639) TaxID=1071378 RepID=G0WEX8_NAUDC|nr:hypothetical protein NDAI_0H01650 [Naumovozyma dairenensis CBS 421]CCD26339.1 hypothetical protein NDAI_0H01650 [Naumovozyma dairenensis CBS 421]
MQTVLGSQKRALFRNTVNKRFFYKLTNSTSVENSTTNSIALRPISQENLYYAPLKSIIYTCKRFYVPGTSLLGSKQSYNLLSDVPTRSKFERNATDKNKKEQKDLNFVEESIDSFSENTLTPSKTLPYASLNPGSTTSTPNPTSSPASNSIAPEGTPNSVPAPEGLSLGEKIGKGNKTDNKNNDNDDLDNEKLNNGKHKKEEDKQNDSDNWKNYEQPNSTAYLKTLSRMEIFSLAFIGLVTLNKLILNLVIKLFPILPTPLVLLFVSRLYCGGTTPKQVLKCGKNLQKRGISNMMLSLTIENSEGDKTFNTDTIVEQTIESIHTILKPNLLEQLNSSTLADVNDIAPGYLALKPSALIEKPKEVLLNFGNIHNKYWQQQRRKLIDNCSKINQIIFDLNKELLKKYPTRKSPFFVCTIDAEKFDLQTKGVYQLQRILMKKFNSTSSPIVSCIGTWQLYLRHSAEQIEMEKKLAHENNYKLGLKIVRGAYMHSEKDRASIIHETKFDTDVNYDQIMTKIMADMTEKNEESSFGHLIVACHNYKSQIVATQILADKKDCEYAKSNVVIGQLLGMADNLTYDLVNNRGAKNIIKYVPWGPPRETKDYLLRRLQENGDAVRNDNGWPLLKNIMKSFFE